MAKCDFLAKDQEDFLAKRSCNRNTLFYAAATLYTDGTTDESCLPLKNQNPSYNIPQSSDSRTLPSCTL